MGLKFEQEHRHVFVYGSLMYLPVWGEVVHGTYACKNATLPGHARFAVPGETYPAMVQQAHALVKGLLWMNVDADDLARLDAFEGPEYERQTVTVHADGLALEAQTYLWRAPAVLDGTLWQVSKFEAEGLQAFLEQHVKRWNQTGQRQSKD
ncbi:MAG TPA: gamma-glutamylcyclotransferase family protein [Limnobacter sp.]|nr:gamma-glutamylcyclotransferase family protein [Limnobacter sp.]